MTARIFLKLIAVVVLLAGAALVVADVLASGVAERHLLAHVTATLEGKGRVLVRSITARRSTRASSAMWPTPLMPALL